jgi:L-seryl-tRNA(Ser) seleniumtransferase
MFCVVGEGHSIRDNRPPSVDALARRLANDVDVPHAVLVDVARRAIAEGGTHEEIIVRALDVGHQLAQSLMGEVINATGVLLHTNLGRAPLAVARGGRAVNVEFDINDGSRGSRHDPIAHLIRLLTGAEAAVVVNNNAAAVLLVLAALAAGRDVAVSRGESVEIGGGFRIPDVMARSGARLVDVGTTNRTRLGDYRAAIDEPSNDVALVMRVHPSNFSIDGFVQRTAIEDLATLEVPVVADLGSGLLDNGVPWLPNDFRPIPSWLTTEPGVRQALAAGADIVTFSGDKLLGGPQCGIIAGRAELVARCAAHPLMRALRPGHHALLPLQEVLLAHLRRDVATTVPFWSMVVRTQTSLLARAAAVVDSAGIGAVERTDAVVGAGAAPDATVPSAAIAISGDHSEALRAASPLPIVARVHHGRTLIDLRAIDPADDALIVDALTALKD